MKRFVWRLQQVLDIRVKEEETSRAELLEVTERLAKTHGQLLRRQRMLKHMISAIAEKKPEKRLSEQELFLKYSVTSDEEIKRIKNQVSELETQQRGKIAEVLKVRRSRRSLERLRAEARKEFMKEQEKLEQKELDEAASISFARKRDLTLQTEWRD
jgi:flagellar FliJ protein